MAWLFYPFFAVMVALSLFATASYAQYGGFGGVGAGAPGTSGFGNMAGLYAPAAPTRFKLSDQGSCVMTAGACSAQSFASTYSVAPICFATESVAGGTVGTLKAPSTTSAVTPASSSGTDTSTVNWICFGN